MKIDRWAEEFGGAEKAHAKGVTGRLAEVNDGEYHYVESTRERSAARMLDRFLSTADYSKARERFKVCGRIVDGRDREVDSACRWVEPGSGND